jgi:hypothetical protein
MQMIPATPYRTNSQAELRVFDLLRSGLPEQGFTAFHSLNLSWHAYKRFGEIDFLICSPLGIYVLEIKGGRIACDETGIWHFTNRDGQTMASPEGPFRQAESALHAIIRQLREHLPGQIVSQFSIGFGVVMPDCRFRIAGAEWDSHTLADISQMHRFDQWLISLFKYWRNKTLTSGIAEPAAIEAVKHYLRPCFEAIVPLSGTVHAVEAEIVALTADQMVLVDIVAANPRVLCSGGAGTGKTFLAVELAKRWSAEQGNVLVACRSPWLSRYLESRMIMANVHICTVDAIPLLSRRQGVESFDALIVDEGQDLFEKSALITLDRYLRGGFQTGKWCIFYDINNQSGLFGPTHPEDMEILFKANPAYIPLRTNCRNTAVILNKVQIMLNADMGIKGAGSGPDVREHIVRSRKESAQILTQELTEILDDDGLRASDITLLSPFRFEESSAALLPVSLIQQIHMLDQYAMRTFPPSGISFCEIPAFKGLENEIIIVIDLPYPVSDNAPHTLHYVSMSRARAVLCVIFLS